MPEMQKYFSGHQLGFGDMVNSRIPRHTEGSVLNFIRVCQGDSIENEFVIRLF